MIEEVVNHIENTKHTDENIHENEVEVKQDDVKKEEEQEVRTIADGATRETQLGLSSVKQAKPKAKPKAKSKSKSKLQQQDTDTKLCKAEMREMADINNQFYALLNRIQQIPNLNDKLTKELLKDKKTQIKVNDEIINLKDSNYIIIEVV
jgi:hypothetical protein